MDLKIKILGTERTNEGKNRFVIKIDDKDITSVLLTDNEVQNVVTAYEPAQHVAYCEDRKCVGRSPD